MFGRKLPSKQNYERIIAKRFNGENEPMRTLTNFFLVIVSTRFLNCLDTERQFITSLRFKNSRTFNTQSSFKMFGCGDGGGLSSLFVIFC